MSVKEYFKSILMSYFIIVTLVNVAIFALGTMFAPNSTFGYSAFLSPLIYAALSLIPYCVMYSKKELSVKRMIIREILQLLSIEAILLFITFAPGRIYHNDYKLMLAFGGSVFIIYVCVNLFCWILDSRSAKKMTEELRNYQNSVAKH